MTFEHAAAAARAASDKTLEKTIVLDVGELIGITDYFIITSGRNDRQVRAIVDEVSKRVRESGGPSGRIEGLESASWVLMDFGSFVVHVFGAEARTHYDLERLWSDAPRVDFSERPTVGAPV